MLSLVPHCPAAVPKTFDCPPGFYCPARDDDDGKGFNAERAAELLLFCPIPSFIPQLQARQRVCNSFPLLCTCDMFIDKELASSLCFLYHRLHFSPGSSIVAQGFICWHHLEDSRMATGGPTENFSIFLTHPSDVADSVVVVTHSMTHKPSSKRRPFAPRNLCRERETEIHKSKFFN